MLIPGCIIHDVAQPDVSQYEVNMNRISKTRYAAAGLAGGFLNGLFGSGGGSAAVPLLEAGGLDPKRSHAMSVVIMMFLSMVSSAGNIFLGNVPWDVLKTVIPAGMAGACAGAFLLRKADSSVLRRIFGGLVLYSGGRMLLS